MPNHFHFLAKQITIDGITKLMRKVSTTDAMYFNKRYHRVGYLFQGKYKAILVETDSYFLHVSRYIHLNPSELKGSDPFNYPYSSYKYFAGRAHASWIKVETILKYFKTQDTTPFLKHHLSYKEFVENCQEDSKEIIGDLMLE
jgi:hypothetical protein